MFILQEIMFFPFVYLVFVSLLDRVGFCVDFPAFIQSRKAYLKIVREMSDNLRFI